MRHQLERVIPWRADNVLSTYKVEPAGPGDNRLVVMAGIAVLDELAEAEDRIEALKQDIADLTETLQTLPGMIPEIRRYSCGPDVTGDDGNFDFAATAEFDDEVAHRIDLWLGAP